MLLVGSAWGSQAWGRTLSVDRGHPAVLVLQTLASLVKGQDEVCRVSARRRDSGDCVVIALTVRMPFG